MASLRIVGTAVDVSELNRLLGELQRKTSNLRPVFRAIDADITGLLREQFETRGARLNGAPWTPIAPVTVELRIARRMLSKQARAQARGATGSDTPLYATGGLYSSFTKPGSPFGYRSVGALEYERGSMYNVSGVPVAVLMQRGFNSPYKPVMRRNGEVGFINRKDGPKAVPARPIVPVTMPLPVIKAWEGQLLDYMERGDLE